MNKKFDTAKVARLGVMAAVSCILVVLIKIPFPPAPFLVYDPADIPIFVTTFAYGPIAGLILTFIVSFIQAFVLGGDALYGFVMHMIATGAFAIIAGNIYNHKKTKKEAIIALVAGVLGMTAIMCVANYFITPLFMGVPRDVVLGMILPIIAPFNLLKGGVNGVITFLVYKRVSKFLHNR